MKYFNFSRSTVQILAPSLEQLDFLDSAEFPKKIISPFVLLPERSIKNIKYLIEPVAFKWFKLKWHTCAPAQRAGEPQLDDTIFLYCLISYVCCCKVNCHYM